MWTAVGSFEKGRPWAYGDLFLAGRGFLPAEDGRFYTWEEQARQILRLVPHVGLEAKTLANWAHVALKFPPGKRQPDLAWSLHRELVDLPLAEALQWLKRARQNDWAVEDLRQARAEAANPQLTREPAAPAGFIPRKIVQDTVRWFRLQLEDSPIEDWPAARRQALKREFQPLLDILNAL